MFTYKSQIVSAHAELCVAIDILTGTRAKRKVMEAIDPALRKELLDAFDKLLDWQQALELAIREAE